MANTNPLNAFQSVFAPFTDAFKNLQGVDVPEAAREFVKQSASTAKERAAEIHTGAGKLTGAIETAVAGSVSETANVTRQIQQAIFEDTQAFLSSLDKLASARSLTDAFQIQSELIRSRGEVAVSRAKSASEYVSKLVADGTKTAQDNFAKATTFGREVA